MPYSAEFYSGGQAIEIDDINQAIPLLEDINQTYFVAKTRNIDNLPAEFKSKVDNFQEYSGHTLFRSK
jgi:hypothetical protein